jgi:hypothetical protein
MFNNRHIQVRFVRDAQTPVVEEPTPVVDPEELARITRNLVKYTATVGVVVMGVAAIFNTLSELAIIEAEAKANSKNR